jgi:hypothetical protein
MKNSTGLFLFSIALTLLAGCQEYCENSVRPPFTESDRAYFFFEPGDTFYFRDTQQNDTFILACTGKDERIDSAFYEDENCIGGGSYTLRTMINFKFNSDIPHFNASSLVIDFEIFKTDSSRTTASILLKVNDLSSYPFSFRFNSETQSLYSIDNSQPVFDYNALVINGLLFDDVYSISFSNDGGDHSNIYYDTIYYNKDGFLKFISSQYGHRLEILE